MFSGSNLVFGGNFINQNRTSRGMDMLLEWVATGASHNSDELYDAPKCHPHTRVAVLEDIMQWVNEFGPAQDNFMLWLFGPAGAGKSAIAKRIAEIAADRDQLIGDFFFSRTSSTRGTKDRLISTLAYQLTVSIPETRSYIEDVIERDPTIFHKNILTQIDTLLIKPLQSISRTQNFPRQKLIIIDGLDECNDSQAQAAILEAISCSFPQHNLPVKFLIVSRPEPDLITSFNCNEPLRYIHHRLVLDDTYRPDDDIRRYFSDKFEQIRLTHPLRSTIPISWPTRQTLETLIAKSSGQFIYASTVVKFVQSRCHRPTARLNIILGVSLPGKLNPFAELDALYHHLLSSVDDIQITLRVLSLYIMTPDFASMLRYALISPELFLSLEPGDIQLALLNLSSIVTYHESSGLVEILHASLVDFLSDKRRSTIFYIDAASTCTDFLRRIFQYATGPDGIQAGHINFFRGVFKLRPWILKRQLRSAIMNFDFDAFLNASIRWRYKERPNLLVSGSTIDSCWTWEKCLDHHAELEDRDKNEALDRLNKSFEPWLQIYQSLVDQHALDLCHVCLKSWFNKLLPVDDNNASAALQCMRFLCNPPPQYSERNECPEMGLIYAEWKATCDMILEMLYKFLQLANALPELVQSISNYDITYPAVQKYFSTDHIWRADGYNLSFLNRARVSNLKLENYICDKTIFHRNSPAVHRLCGI